ncbi:putative uncharacterized protein [Bacteroides sp. CAG:709]|nr:putative uncharacterized protein [Bacteroides sp. CAG:709]
MAGDNLGIVNIQSCELGTLLCDKLMAGTVSTVFADPVILIILVRKTIHVGISRNRLMECRIESNNLRNRRENSLHSPDTQDMGRIMQRCEIAAYLDLLHDILIDKSAGREILTSMHNSVAHSLDVVKRLQNAMLAICKCLKDKLHSHLVVRNRNILYDFLLTGSGMLETSHFQADLFYDTFSQDIINLIALHIKKLILDR